MVWLMPIWKYGPYNMVSYNPSWSCDNLNIGGLNHSLPVKQYGLP